MMNFKSYFLLFISILSFSFLSYSKDIYVNDASTTGDVWCTAAGSASGTGTKASPYLTLKAALDAVDPIASNFIYVDDGDYRDASNLDKKNQFLVAKSNVSIIGAGSHKTTFIGRSGTIQHWFMKIDGVTNFSISNITTMNFDVRDDVIGQNFTILNSDKITIKNVTFSINDNTNGDCAIYIGDNSTNILIDGSSASCQNKLSGGGGIRIGEPSFSGPKGSKNISVEIKNSLLTGNDNSNQGSNGAAIQVFADLSVPNPNLILKVENCIFSRNKAKKGGAIYIEGGSVTINKCKFIGNKTTNTTGTDGGGAIWVSKTHSICTISNSEFKDNEAGADGGAIQVYTGVGAADVKIENCLFENNKGVNGNDIHTRMKTGKKFNVTVKNCSFKSIGNNINNIVSGPAVVCDYGILNIEKSGTPGNVGLPSNFNSSCQSLINIDNLPSGYTDPGISFPPYQETCPNATICNPAIPGAAPTVTCPANTANLTVTGPSNSTFTWYSDSVPTGGTVIGNTSNISPASPDFTTPTISATKKFYVVSSLDNCQTRVPITVNYDCPTCTSTITYGSGPFCQKDKVSPTVTPTPSGSVTYSCTAADAPNAKTDLIINSSTGEIDLANSKPGKYTIQCEVSATCKPTVEIIIKPTPATPTLGTPVDPTCASEGSVVISGLPSPLSGSITWTLKSTAKYNFSTTGNTATYNYTDLKPNSKIKFIVELDGCLSDSTAELTVANAPGKPYLEGPSSVCVNSEITLKAWTDNSKGTKSTPKVSSAWTLKETSDNDTVSLTTGTDPGITSNKIKGLKVVSATKAGEATIVYEDNNGCTSEQTIKVNPLPVTPVLSYVTSNTGEIIDTVCIRKDVNFNLSGNIGDSVFFKGKNAPFRYKIISPIPNVFTINNILRDTTIILDSISNGTCVSKFSGSTEIKLKITVVDTAFSLKAFPTTNCGTSTGKIEVTTYSKGRIVWVNNSDNSLTGKEDVAANTTTMTPILSLKAGTYTVKFLNGGCELSKTVTVSDPNAPYLEADVTSSPLSICAGDSIVLKAWTDNTKATKSTPKSNQAWLPDNLNVTLKDTVNPTSTPPTTLQRVVANTGGTSVITYTDINGCKADITVSIKTAGIPTTINNTTDLVQSFCAADINRVSNLKPVGLIWFDEKGTVELAATTDLKAQFYYAAIKDVSTGCFTKKSDRIKVEVKINANPNDPAANPVQTSFCKIDDPEVADLIPAPSSDIKWFLKSVPTLTPQVPTDKLTKKMYVVKKLKDGCLSVNGVEVEVDVISVPKPKAPNQKLCANNEKPLTLGGLYTSDITNYYFYDLSNASLFPSKIVLDGEQYKVKQSLNGCLSEDTTITIKILDGTSLSTSKYILTPAFCKVDGPTLAAIEAKYSALPTSGSIFWYDAQNSSLTNDLPKTADLGGTAYSLWIAVKDADGCFSKKQQVDFAIDPGKKPDLKPIELCKTTDYTLTNLDVANISNPKGILTWYLSQTGVGLAPPTVPKNSSQKYWASYKETATSCEGERKDLNINWIDLSQPFSIDFKNQKFCKTANKTVDDLNPAPFTDANIAWFENTSTNIPYPAIDLLADKIYYASQYQITSAGDYCVNPNRIPVNVALYSNKIYPIVKESVCSKQNGSIEFINPPAGLTFDWYEQSNPTTLDFTGAKYTKPLENQSFKIKIKDSFGCEEEVSVSLPECSDSPIPQILSPNNDAYNNKWVINYSGKYKNVQVRIFNRWGNEVFTSAIPYKDDWDGKRNNEYLPSGTYYYVIDKGNGDPIESGYIELIK